MEIVITEDISSRIDGEELFTEAYNISRMFRFTYTNGCIHIILDKINLDKHYLMYLIGILIKINGMISKKK